MSIGHVARHCVSISLSKIQIYLVFHWDPTYVSVSIACRLSVTMICLCCLNRKVSFLSFQFFRQRTNPFPDVWPWICDGCSPGGG